MRSVRARAAVKWAVILAPAGSVSVGTLSDRALAIDGTLTVDVSQAFVTPPATR